MWFNYAVNFLIIASGLLLSFGVAGGCLYLLSMVFGWRIDDEKDSDSLCLSCDRRGYCCNADLNIVSCPDFLPEKDKP